MQQLNDRNNEEVTCRCGKNQPIKYISFTKKTLHCSKCMSQCEGLVEYEPFQKALFRLKEKREQTIEEVMKQIESTFTLYEKIFHTMKMDLQKYQEAFDESKILFESFGCEDLCSLLQKLTLRLDENQDVLVEIEGDKSISEIEQKLQKMNIYIKNELIECKEVENKTWLTEAKKLSKTGKKVYFLDEYILIQETHNQIYLLNQESAVLYQNKFDNKIMGLYKSPNNKIIIAREKLHLNVLIQDDKSIFIQKQIPLDKKIFQFIFNEASDLIIYSCSDCIEFLQIKNHQVTPLGERLPHDQLDKKSVPIYALAESNNQLVSMNLLGTIKIYHLNLEHIYLKQTAEFNNKQFYDFLHFKNQWILAGIMASQFQIFQVNNSEKLINKIMEQEIGDPKDQGQIIYKNDLLVQLIKDKVSIYRIKNADIQHLVNLDFKSCELTSCDISQDGTQLIITGNKTVIYNLFY